MNSIEISAIVIACTFAGGMCGMLLRNVLPEHHLSSDAKDLIRLAMGLIGTMTALVLGLLIASAKDSYDTKSKELTEMSANLVLLDRVLAHYGPEAGPIRGLLRSATVRMLDQTWSKNSAQRSSQDPTSTPVAEVVYDRIQGLSPTNDVQRRLQSNALSLAMDIGKTRWLMFEQGGNSIATPFLVMLVFWLTLLFTSFGLLAKPNPTVIATLLLCALCVSGAILLILEMYKPFEGLIQISPAPLRTAIAHLDAP